MKNELLEGQLKSFAKISEDAKEIVYSYLDAFCEEYKRVNDHTDDNSENLLEFFLELIDKIKVFIKSIDGTQINSLNDGFLQTTREKSEKKLQHNTN